VVNIRGVHVTESDAYWVIDRLRAVGRADDATAAHAIEIGIDYDQQVELDDVQQVAVMMSLAGAPEGLMPLRRTLARNHRDRHV